MSKDEGIKDECFYTKAYPDDNGDRQNIPAGVDIWHSPGLVIFELGDENEKQVEPILAGHQYGWKVSINRKGTEQCLPKNDTTEALHVEFYISFPSTHPNPAWCKKIGAGLFTSLPSPGKSNWARFDNIKAPDNTTLKPWSPSTIETDLDGPGDRCLVGRIYPATPENSPDELSFHFPDDPHVAQHNIFITEASVDARSAKFNFISTGEARSIEPENATLRAVFDTRPERDVSPLLRQRLTQRPSFKRVVRSAPRRFELELPDFTNPVVHDNTRRGCLGTLMPGRRRSSFEAQVQIDPARIHRSYLTADLSGSTPGDAHIFHVTQVGRDGRTQGGLTWAVITI